MTADGWNSYQIDFYMYPFKDSIRNMHTIYRPLLILDNYKAVILIMKSENAPKWENGLEGNEESLRI